MAKKSKAALTTISHVGPSHDPAFEAGYENSAMASEHESWKTDITPVMGSVNANPHEEVDEVHQGDIPFGPASGKV